MCQSLLKRMLLGAVAGLAGTVALQLLEMGKTQVAPDAEPPMKDDPGAYMARIGLRRIPPHVRLRLPMVTEELIGTMLGLSYGATFGAVYAAVQSEAFNVVIDGTVLGIGCWAAGYLGWLPATGLMPPVWEHEPAQAITPVVEHVAYGIATVAAYEGLRSVL